MKTITLIHYVFWCSILFYFLLNIVLFLVGKNVEHIDVTILVHEIIGGPLHLIFFYCCTHIRQHLQELFSNDGDPPEFLVLI